MKIDIQENIISIKYIWVLQDTNNYKHIYVNFYMHGKQSEIPWLMCPNISYATYDILNVQE